RVARGSAVEGGAPDLEDARAEEPPPHRVLHEHPRGLARGDLEEVDDLGDDDRGGDGPHLVAQGPQARYEAVVRETQERPARDVTDAGGLEHDHARAAERVAQIDLP